MTQQTGRESIFTDADHEQAKCYPTLGPIYFAARRFVAGAIAGDDSIDAKGLAKKFSDDVYSQFLDTIENCLISDAETNIQGYIHRAVDEIIEGLLAGHRWPLERYALLDRYHADKIREAIAKHIPQELQDMRVADLEKEISKLREENKYLRGRP